MKHCFWISVALMAVLAGTTEAEELVPKTIAYQGQPNAYFNDHAEDVAHILDGLYFVVGSWDDGVDQRLGTPGGQAPESEWKRLVRENIAHLRAAGATENLLGVHFSSNGDWPSAPTLLSKNYAGKMAAYFGVVGRAAKELGFRGVSIDVEYPYPRYEVDNEIYTYEGYTVQDLMSASRTQGRTVMSALLDAFPEAVIFVLPGSFRSRPIEREFQLGLIDVMAERDAPGGFHIATERAYTLYEYPVTQVAICRSGDLEAHALLSGETLDYWKRRCTVAPGAWPLHMVETGGKNYPVQPWAQELGELRDQMAILKSLAKRYIWCYSGQPIWYQYTPELGEKYGLRKPAFDGADEAIAGWQAILADRQIDPSPRVETLLAEARRLDKGKLSPAEFCSRLGTPGAWLVLGPLSNPFTEPAYTAPEAALLPPQQTDVWHGRDGALRWFQFDALEPTGGVSLLQAFDWRATHFASAHCAADIIAKRPVEGIMGIGWDDGIVVRLNDEIVFDHPEYPERGHGRGYRDKYLFEEKVPVTIPAGRSRLVVTDINQKGLWGFNIRFFDKDGYPLQGVEFDLPED